MSKFKTVIKYYNRGKKISETPTTLAIEEITQDKVDIALRLMLQIHLQKPPHEATAKVYSGTKVLAEFKYAGDTLEEFDPDSHDEYK